MKFVVNRNIDLVTANVKQIIRVLYIVLLFMSVAMQNQAQTIDVTMDCDANVNIPVIGVDGTGHNIFESGSIKISYDGLFGRWLIYQNGTFVFFQNSVSKPNPPSNLSWTAFGNNGCSTVTLFNVTTTIEICDNGIDDDGDSFIDCLDVIDCYAFSNCNDSDGDGIINTIDIDDDNDGLTDGLELYNNSSNSQPTCGGSTVLDLSANPILINGLALSEGSVYKYANAAVGVDMLITIMEINNATLNDIDDNSFGASMFNPQIEYYFNNSGEQGYVDFKTSFLIAGTNTSIALDRIMLNFNNVDGDFEYKEKVWTVIPSSYSISNSTELTVSPIVSNDWFIMKSGVTGYGLPLNVNPEINLTAIYNKVKELRFRFGVISTVNSYINPVRWQPVDFSCVTTYVSPHTYDMDNDLDGVINMLDLDSDNDGVYDVDEGVGSSFDFNNDGMIDGAVGSNGLGNVVETFNDSGVLNHAIPDSDSDGILDVYELDSDNDGCSDVIEAGYSDSNNDGFLGGTPLDTDGKGKVIFTP